MALVLQSDRDILPFLGKKVLRVSLSAYDMGLHFLEEQVLLIESFWVLQDQEGREIDRGLGLKIRETCSLGLLFDQAVKRVDSKAGLLDIIFDRHCLRILIAVNSPSSQVQKSRLENFQGVIRWDPLVLTAPGYLLDKKTNKKAPVYQIRDLLTDQKMQSLFYGQPIVRVAWSAQEAGLYFLGNSAFLINAPWLLFDRDGKEMDNALNLKTNHDNKLFRLIGLTLISALKEAGISRIVFDQGIVLTLGNGA
ncbi:MAG: hypothetical protein HQL14_08090 [Candidatus Omnitrophica bacterium]|nr:hypothetical protein [Candidatus Omnitrophota bacterium]